MHVYNCISTSALNKKREPSSILYTHDDAAKETSNIRTHKFPNTNISQNTANSTHTRRLSESFEAFPYFHEISVNFHFWHIQTENEVNFIGSTTNTLTHSQIVSNSCSAAIKRSVMRCVCVFVCVYACVDCGILTPSLLFFILYVFVCCCFVLFSISHSLPAFVLKIPEFLQS